MKNKRQLLVIPGAGKTRSAQSLQLLCPLGTGIDPTWEHEQWYIYPPQSKKYPKTVMSASPSRTWLSTAKVHNHEWVGKFCHKQSLFLSQAGIQSLTEFSITSNGNSSPAELFLQVSRSINRVLLYPKIFPHISQYISSEVLKLLKEVQGLTRQALS